MVCLCFLCFAKKKSYGCVRGGCSRTWLQWIGGATSGRAAGLQQCVVARKNRFQVGLGSATFFFVGFFMWFSVGLDMACCARRVRLGVRCGPGIF
jgi:hypothetical protein